jgi:hypothetical protein
MKPLFPVLMTMAAALIVGCAATTGSDESTNDALTAASDGPDHHCAVVLRTASVDFQNVTSDKRWFRVTADVDVSAASVSHGGAPGLVWIDMNGASHSTSSSDDPPHAIAGAASGFQRFRFELTHDTISAQGIDSTIIAMSHVALLPFVALPGGHRTFDHNRVTGDFDTYTLWSGDTAGGLVQAPANNPQIGAGFKVSDAPSVCRHP